MKTLDETKQEVLAVITEYVDTFWQAPTFRQIMDHLDARSFKQVHLALKELCDEGKLYQPAPGQFRGYQPTEEAMDDWESSQVLVEREVVRFKPGHIRASDLRPEWIDVIQVASTGKRLFDPNDDIIEVPRSMLPASTDRLLALRVSGDSLQDSFVTDGDVIILRLAEPGYRPAQGEIVAAGSLETNEVTLKHYYEMEDCVELRPANDKYSPIQLAKDTVHIIGTMVMRWHVWEPQGMTWPWDKRRDGFYKLFSHVYGKQVLFRDILRCQGATPVQISSWGKDRTWFERFVVEMGPRFLAITKGQVAGCNARSLDLYYGLTQPSLGSLEAVAERLRTTPSEVRECLMVFIRYLRTQQGKSSMEALVLKVANKVTVPV